MDMPTGQGSESGRAVLWTTLAWGLLLLTGLLPVLALGYYAYRVTSRSVRDLVEQDNAMAAQMAAKVIGNDLQNATNLLQALNLAPGMMESVLRHDRRAVADRLRVAVHGFPHVDRAFVVDPHGLLWAIYPEAPESLEKNFANCDYFRGLSQQWQPYVSEAFRQNALPRKMVVGVAVPIRDTDQTLLGGLVCDYRLDEVVNFLRDLRTGDSGYVFVLDHYGNVAAHPKLDLQVRPYADYAALAPVQAALKGRSGATEYDDPLAKRRMVANVRSVLVAGHYWVVIAQQPVDEAYAPIRQLGYQLAIATGLLALVALGVVLVLGNIRRRLRQANRELVADIAQRKGAEDEVQKKQRLLRQLLDVYEQHRKLAAHEIHDGIAQPLAGAVMHCEGLLQQARQSPPNQLTDGLEKTVELLQESLLEARCVMRSLRPAILDDFGIVEAVDQLVREGRATTGRTIEWSHDVHFDRIAAPLETVLYRIIQESLANALRHSQGTRVRVELVQVDRTIQAVIEDDGRGFNQDAVAADSFGLKAIRERAKLFGGHATIDSSPGCGTRVTVRLPLVERGLDDD